MFVLIEMYDGELGIARAHDSEKECRELMWKRVKECAAEDYLFDDYCETCVEHFIPSKDEHRIYDKGAGYDVAAWNYESAWYDGGIKAQWQIEEIR